MSIITNLIEELREYASYCSGHSTVENMDYAMNLYLRAANVIEMLSEKARPVGWIPCCERLPEEGVFVLVTYENVFKRRFVKMLKRVKDYWVDSDGYRHFYRSIVAWMPLPERYTESEEEE